MAKQENQSQQFVSLPVKSPVCKVSACPNTKHLPEDQQHKNRRIYKTDGKTRRCKCNDCGATWKMVDGEASDGTKFLIDLAESLESAPAAKLPGVDAPAIIISQSEAMEISAKLRELAAE